MMDYLEGDIAFFMFLGLFTHLFFSARDAATGATVEPTSRMVIFIILSFSTHYGKWRDGSFPRQRTG
jgi:hypothetical protein